MKPFVWTRDRLKHKLSHLSLSAIKSSLKENGPALAVIIVTWEIIEDVLFPILFAWLGVNVHPVFLAGIPASIVLCSHWIAVPLIWSAWVKVSKNTNK